MSTLPRRSRLLFVLSFTAISLAALFLTTARTPSGPWEGLYRSFLPTWIFLGVAVLAALGAAYSEDTKLRVLTVVSVLLVVALVAAPTVKWGVPYGIRDPWKHLYYIRTGTFFGENPYPMMHSLIRLTTDIAGVNAELLLARVQILGPVVGTLWSVVMVKQLDSESWHIGLLALFPAVFIWIISRPYTVGPLFVILAWWAVLRTDIDTRHRAALLIVVFAALWWHPVAALLAGLILVATFLVKQVGRRSPVRRWFEELRAVKMPLVAPAVFLGVIFVSHLLFLTSFFENTITRATLAVVANEPVQSQNAQTIQQIPAKIFEVLRRAMFVLALGLVAGAATLRSLYRGRYNEILLSSLVAVVSLAAVFFVLGLVPGVGFGVRRAAAIAPLTLLPAAAIALRQTPRRRRLVVAVLLVSAGLAVAHSSPIISGQETSTTQSDVASVTWLNDARATGSVVVGSENTLHIVEGIYGQEALDDWTNRNEFRYMSVRRQEPFSWMVSVNSKKAYYSVSKPARIKASGQRSVSASREFRQFTSNKQRVYDNGNVWLFTGV